MHHAWYKNLYGFYENAHSELELAIPDLWGCLKKKMTIFFFFHRIWRIKACMFTVSHRTSGPMNHHFIKCCNCKFWVMLLHKMNSMNIVMQYFCNHKYCISVWIKICSFGCGILWIVCKFASDLWILGNETICHFTDLILITIDVLLIDFVLNLLGVSCWFSSHYFRTGVSHTCNKQEFYSTAEEYWKLHMHTVHASKKCIKLIQSNLS